MVLEDGTPMRLILVLPLGAIQFTIINSFIVHIINVNIEIIFQLSSEVISCWTYKYKLSHFSIHQPMKQIRQHFPRLRLT